MNAVTYAEHVALSRSTEPVADVPWCSKCKEDCTGVEVEIALNDDGDLGPTVVSECCDADVFKSGKLVEPGNGCTWEAPDAVEPMEYMYDASDCGW